MLTNNFFKEIINITVIKNLITINEYFYDTD